MKSRKAVQLAMETVIVSIIHNVLNISNVSPFYQYIAKGAVLLIAMILNSRKKKL